MLVAQSANRTGFAIRCEILDRLDSIYGREWNYRDHYREAEYAVLGNAKDCEYLAYVNYMAGQSGLALPLY